MFKQASAPSTDRYRILPGTTVVIQPGIVWLRRGKWLRIDGTLVIYGILSVQGKR